MISIIVPVYNGAEWLAEAIESALNQNKKAEKIIIVDDGSTDNSLEIAKKYVPVSNGMSVWVVHQVNKGLSSARNFGILADSLLSSEFLLFLDADDKLLPNAIERIESVIKQNPDADVIAPSFKEFGLSDREVILMQNPTIEDFKVANRIGYCAAIRRSALLEVGGYSPRMTWGAEDYHLWFNLLSRGKKIVTIPEVLWMYRTRENSMWSETQKHKDEFMAQIKKDFPNEFPR